jgi:hypothetical protein
MSEPSRFVAMDTYTRKGKWAIYDMRYPGAADMGRQVACGMSRTMAVKVGRFLNAEAAQSGRSEQP